MYDPEDLVEPRPLSRRRRWLRILAVFAVFVGIAAVLCGYAWYKADRELQAALDETTKKDPHWRFPDIQADRAVIPEERNSARVVASAKQQLPGDWPIWDHRPRPAGSPFADAESPQAKLAAGFQDLDPPVRLSAAQEKALRDEIKRAEPALKEARKLAGLPDGRHPITYSVDVLSTLFTPIQDTRQVAALLANDVLLRAQDGNADGALASCRGILNAARSIGDEPNMIAQLVRIACRAVALTSLQRLLAQGEPSEESLRQFQELLEQEEPVPLLTFALRGERASIDRFLEGLQKGDVNPAVLANNGEVEGKLLGLTPAPIIKSQRAAALRYLNRFFDVLALDWPEQQAGLKQLELEGRDAPLFVRLLVPAVSKVAAAQQRSRAQLRCAIALVAVERYRRANGRWPEALPIVKEAGLLSRVPADPYDGQPLRYRRLDDGVVIYSVGPDGQDDGGNLDPKNPVRPGSDLGYRLWDVPRRARPAPEPPPQPEGKPEGAQPG